MKTPEKRVFGTRLLLFFLLLLPVLLTACAKFHMVYQDAKPKLAVKSGKAVLIIIRPTILNSGDIINNYLDGKIIGQTKSKSYFITEIKPGMHYLTAEAANKDTAYMSFASGRIYFIQQGVFPGYNKSTTRYIPMTLSEALKQINEAAHVVYDTKNPAKDMVEKDYQEAKKDYEREVKEDPKTHLDMKQYKGYSRVK